MFTASNRQAANLAGVTLRMTTMTRLLSIVTLGAALSMTVGIAFAGETVSADKIVRALKPTSPTRGLSMAAPQVDTAKQMKEVSFLNLVRNRKTRSLSFDERQEMAEIAATKPKIDLEILFDNNSADISKSSEQAVEELAKALSDPSLKGSTFMVAGHTDAKGGESYNQSLSERRADTIKKVLSEEFGIKGSDLVTVGYGKSQPKDPRAPEDAVNRRVQVVNMDTKTAEKQ